jgi:ribosomal protein S18 acetylase RimI-like enzyme
MRIVSNPKPEHLLQIFTWLHEEFMNSINGFYGNYDVINNAFINKRIICAVDNEKSIGYLVYSYDKLTANILIANVKTEYKNKGIGKKLLNFLEKKLINKGIKAIDLKCSPVNSKKIWKKLGFKELKEIKNHCNMNNWATPYLYKILVESEKPVKSNAKSKYFVELFCNDPIKNDAIPNYKWKINPNKIATKPIIYSVDSEWILRYYIDGELKKETKIKKFYYGKYSFNNFLIVNEVPFIND